MAVTYDGSASKPEGVKVYVNGQPQPTTTQNNTLKNTIRTDVPLTIGSRHNTERLFGNLIEDLRLYDRVLTPAEIDQLGRYGAARRCRWRSRADKRTPAEITSTFDWWLATFDKPSRDLEAEIAKLLTEEAGIKARGTIAHVMARRRASRARSSSSAANTTNDATR